MAMRRNKRRKRKKKEKKEKKKEKKKIGMLKIVQQYNWISSGA
jgi:hypothetical protein